MSYNKCNKIKYDTIKCVCGHNLSIRLFKISFKFTKSQIYLCKDYVLTKEIVSYYVNRPTALNQRKRNRRIWETEIKNNLRCFSHFQQGNWRFDGSLQTHCLYLQHIELTRLGLWSQQSLQNLYNSNYVSKIRCIQYCAMTLKYFRYNCYP